MSDQDRIAELELQLGNTKTLLEYLRSEWDNHASELYCCPKCGYGYIDKICPAEGFWEKGVNEDDKEIFACNGCGEWVVVHPATLEDLNKNYERRK